MTTVTDRVSASLHDCHDTGNGNNPFFNGTSVLWWGEDADVIYDGMIWDGVSIPDGATINTGTYIQVIDVQFGTYSGKSMYIKGVEATTLTAWSDGDGPPDRAGSATTATVTWTANISSGATGTSPELNALLQEIIDDTSGTLTDLTLYMYGDSGSDQRTDLESYDTTAAEAPYVNIEYTAGGGGGPAPVFRRLMLMGVGR